MSKTWQALVGPRTPADVEGEKSVDYMLPTIFLGLAALCLIISIFLPYWILTLEAPQYPKGLHVQTYVNRLEGDVQEIDGHVFIAYASRFETPGTKRLEGPRQPVLITAAIHDVEAMDAAVLADGGEGQQRTRFSRVRPVPSGFIT